MNVQKVQKISRPPQSLKFTRIMGLAPLRISSPASPLEWMLFSAMSPWAERRRNTPEALHSLTSLRNITIWKKQLRGNSLENDHTNYCSSISWTSTCLRVSIYFSLLSKHPTSKVTGDQSLEVLCIRCKVSSRHKNNKNNLWSYLQWNSGYSGRHSWDHGTRFPPAAPDRSYKCALRPSRPWGHISSQNSPGWMWLIAGPPGLVAAPATEREDRG